LVDSKIVFIFVLTKTEINRNNISRDMSTKRMTGIDYRREWHLIQQEVMSLEAHVRERLKELIKIHPDAEIDVNTTAKELTNRWINHISPLEIIKYIEKIEASSAEQQSVIQTKIKL
jgi:hypothetical protein